MELLNYESLSDIPYEDFKIETREDAVKFEEYLSALHDNNLQCPGKIIYGLGNIFDVCHQFKKEYGSRVFTAIIDIAISQTNCTCELDDCIKAWNRYFATDNLYGNNSFSSILQSEKSFEGRFFYQRYLNSFVLKYRAHWDKIMGLYFLVYKFDLYKKFIRAHKKKRLFLKEFEGFFLVDSEVVNYVKIELTHFDREYRTHEAHGTGRIRKFTFSGGPAQSSNPIYDIINDKYGKYTTLAPKIYQCVAHLLNFPAIVERLRKENQN